MPAHAPNLPTQAIDHMSPVAKENVPDQIQGNFGDPGIFRTAGSDTLAVYGTGWYHYSDSTDQNFIGHDKQADFFLFDFGSLALTGNDTIDEFEASPTAPLQGGPDAIFITNVLTYPLDGTLTWGGAPFADGSSFVLTQQYYDWDSQSLIGSAASWTVKYYDLPPY